MTDEERELVEMMAESLVPRSETWTATQVKLYEEILEVCKREAETMLSVVKANLGKIAEVCPMCNGQGWYEQHTGDNEREQRECECQSGIVPKGT
jgi:hypothetical protein